MQRGTNLTLAATLSLAEIGAAMTLSGGNVGLDRFVELVAGWR